MNLCLILYQFEQYLNILSITKSIKYISDIREKLYTLTFFELEVTTAYMIKPFLS